jgi:hypothetical protein
MWPQIVAALHIDTHDSVGFGVSTLAVLLTCLFCGLLGRADDRLGAVVFGLGWVAATVANWISGMPLGDPHMPILVGVGIDGAVASAFLVLAIRHDNLWLGAASAFQGLQLAILALERSILADGALTPLIGGLLIVHNSLNFVMMACMAASTLGHMRRAPQAA